MAVTIIVGAVVGSKNRTLEVVQAPTPKPTMAPTEIPSSAPTGTLDLLVEDLPDYTRESLKNGSSPQWKAYDWLLNHGNITRLPEWRKKQLFALATFYYAFEGPHWPQYIQDDG